MSKDCLQFNSPEANNKCGLSWMVLETLETTHSVSVAFRSMAVIVFQLKNTTIQITPLKVPTIFKMFYSIIVWKWECRWDLSSLKRKDNLILVEGPRPYSAPTCNRVRRLKAAMTKVLQNFSSGGPIEHLFDVILNVNISRRSDCIKPLKTNVSCCVG